MQDHDKTNVTANPDPAAAKTGGQDEPSKPGAGTGAGNAAPGSWDVYSTKIEGWISDPRAPAVLVGVIFFLFAIAVFSG